MRAITRHRLEEMERQYNPDNDIPDGPRVSWAEYYLLQAVRNLFEDVERLDMRVSELNDSLRAIGSRDDML